MLLTQNKSEERHIFLQRVMILSYRKMSYLDEILRLTKEIGESLDRDDRVSVQLLLVSRQEEIENLDECRINLHEEMENLSNEESFELEKILKGKFENPSAEDAELMKEGGEFAYLAKIDAYSKASKKYLEEIIVLDKRMSNRLAGEDSFYQEKSNLLV